MIKSQRQREREMIERDEIEKKRNCKKIIKDMNRRKKEQKQR